MKEYKTAAEAFEDKHGRPPKDGEVTFFNGAWWVFNMYGGWQQYTFSPDDSVLQY